MKIFFNIIVFIVTTFIAWNFCGILLIVSIATLFFTLEQLKFIKWYTNLLILFLICFLLNIAVTFWLFNMSRWESIFIFFCNGLVLTIPLGLYQCINIKNDCLRFAIIWISFEVLHTKWDLNWPWITFGNVMGNQHYLVQWYSIFGVYSGSLWLIILGHLLFRIVSNFSVKGIKIFCIILLLPIILSLAIYFLKPLNNDNNLKISTYIPKNDNYKTNFQRINNVTKAVKDESNIKFLISPEIFFRNTHPQNFQSGSESYSLNKIFKENENLLFIFGTEFYNSKNQLFNCVSVLSNDKILSRTKKKYVPIREYIPKNLRFIYGDTFYTKNTIDDTKKIESATKISLMLCYESVFSSFMANETFNTDLIFVLTSEHFMKNSTIAKKQYINIIKLRAIECNRNILKCSDGGISCIINEKGDVVKYIKTDLENNLIFRITENSIYQNIIRLL